MTEFTVCHEQPLDSSAKIENRQTPLSIRLYLGGSFDPPHNAHLALLAHVYHTLSSVTATATGATFKLTAEFLPTARSPLKTASTDPKYRLNMLQLACVHLNKQAAFITATTTVNTGSNAKLSLVSNEKKDIDTITAPLLNITTDPSTPAPFTICEHELWQPPPIYTIHTLQALRDKHPDCSLIFILGADSVASLSQWQAGDRLTEFAHLWIMPRNMLQTPDSIRALLPTKMQNQVTQNLQALQQTTHGYIYIDTQQVAPISSSQIRQAIAQPHRHEHYHHDFLKSALPHSVYSYIMANQLYR